MNEPGLVSSELDSGFSLGQWRVEPTSNTIFQGDQEKHLENRLMRTLVFLAENHGQVISREQFFDTVWQGLVVNEEALSRAISLLRTALDDDAQAPKFIQTFPGVGYRLIAEPVVVQKQAPIASRADDDGEKFSQATRHIEKTSPGDHSPSLISKNLNRIIGISVALVIGFLAVDKFVLDPIRDASNVESALKQGRSEGLVESFEDNSIAVLPFVNMSSDPEQEFFADGMTEELLNMLANVPELRVTARTSSFFFKGKDVPVPRIAETLNVKHILEGSVRRSGDKVRITAQLVEARSDRHLWSKTYNRDLEDIFTIQDEVATAIVEALTDSIGELNTKRVSRSSSLAAFEAYRTGRLRWWRRSVAEIHQAIDLFEQAIEHDPGFAPAYAALADSRLLLVTYGDMHIVEGEDLAEVMIDKALELDPESAEAYAALGLSRLITGRKEEAEAAFRLALAYDPAYIPAYVWMSAMFSDLGRAPEEGAILLKAMSMDPLNELLVINYAENLQTRGDNEGAMTTLESLLRMQPDHVVLLCSLSTVNLNSGALEQAWLAARHAYDLEPQNVVAIIAMATTWRELGEFKKADKIWQDGLKQNPKSVELKVQYLTMMIIEGRVEDTERLMQRLFGDDVGSLAAGYQRTYHYFMGLLTAVKGEYLTTRDHFERVIDPIVDQLFDRDQIFVLTTAALINFALGEIEMAEQQLATAERVIGHARVDGIDNMDIYYSASAVLAMRGDKQRALQNLQQAYDRGFRQVWKLKLDGRLDDLRDEPVFITLLAQIEDDIESAREEVRQLVDSLN